MMRNPILNEYELLESANKVMNDYDVDSLHSMQESVLTSVPTKMVSYIYKVSAKNDIEAIDASIENINMVSVNHKDMADFFANIHRGSDLYEDKPIAVSLRNINEVEDIRAQYIDLFVDSIGTTVNDIVNGKITSKDELKRNQLNPLYFAKVKRNTVKSVFPIEASYKTLLNYTDNLTTFKVTEEFLMSVVLPFLRNYGDTSKKLTIESVKLKNSITRGFDNLRIYMETYNNLLTTKIETSKSKTITFYLYNVGRMYLELTNYAAYMMVRKVNNYAQNVTEFMNLYNSIKAFYPEGRQILHESVLDASFADLDEISNVSDVLDGQCSVFNAFANKVYNSHRTDLDMIRSDNSTCGVSVFDTDITDDDYDKTCYNLIDETLEKVLDIVKSIEENAKDPYLAVYDLKDKIFDGMTLTERFNSVLCGISDISVYGNQISEDSEFRKETVFMTIMNELREFPKNMTNITNTISGIYDVIKKLRERLKDNINGEFTRFSDVGDLVSLTDEFEVQFRDMILVICKSIVKRLESLDDMASHIISLTYESGEFDVSDDTDYIKESVLSCMSSDDIIAKTKVSASQKLMFEKSMETSYGGKVFLEDTPVEVENNEETKAENPTEAKQEETDNKEELQNLLNETKTFMSEKINGFGSKLDAQAETNKTWLEQNKETCLNRKLRNTKITIYNYDTKVQNRVVSDIQALTTNINHLNDEATQGDKTEIINNLFGFINLSSGDSIRDKMNQWYISGSNTTQKEEVQNSQIESRIPGMISYCEAYYNNLGSNVKAALDSLAAAWETKLGSFKNPNMEVVKEINKQVKYYTGCVMNAVRDRTFAYLKTLKSILPAGAEKKEAENEPTQQTETQPTQNETSTEQNAEATQ